MRRRTGDFGNTRRCAVAKYATWLALGRVLITATVPEPTIYDEVSYVYTPATWKATHIKGLPVLVTTEPCGILEPV